MHGVRLVALATLGLISACTTLVDSEPISRTWCTELGERLVYARENNSPEQKREILELQLWYKKVCG